MPASGAEQYSCVLSKHSSETISVILAAHSFPYLSDDLSTHPLLAFNCGFVLTNLALENITYM